MADYLAEAPPTDTMTPSQAEVLREVRKMLEALRPSQVVPEQTKAMMARKGELEIHIPHRGRPDDSLTVTVDERDIGVGFGHDHLHFDRERYAEWLDEGLHFIWQILRGEIEVEVTFKGRVPLKTRVFSGGGRWLAPSDRDTGIAGVVQPLREEAR
jgi:hypothetical protein